MEFVAFFVWSFLAVQMWLPVSYYILPSGDAYDEQYAWRMFSETSMAMSRVDWFCFDNTTRRNDVGVALKPADFRHVGISKAYTKFLFGSGTPGKSTPPSWVLDRAARQLFELLPANITAIAARRVIAPMYAPQYFEESRQWEKP